MAISQREKDARRPIRRPVLTKDGREDLRLESTQDLLGIRNTKEYTDERGYLTARGHLKEQCYIYLLVSEQADYEYV